MESVKRDFLYNLQGVIFEQSTFQLVQLFHLRAVNKQWRSSITARMIADAIQRELPKLIGLPLDKPIDFYVDMVCSYYAKCGLTRVAVGYQVSRYATENFCSSLRNTRCELPKPTIQAHLFCLHLAETLRTREGRGLVLASLSEWREEAIRSKGPAIYDGSVKFYDEAVPFLDNLERIMYEEFVVIGRHITTGIIRHREPKMDA